jgi:hypothetical protein
MFPSPPCSRSDSRDGRDLAACEVMTIPPAFYLLREAVQIGVLAMLAVLVAVEGASGLTPFLIAAAFFVALNGYLRTRAWLT